MGFDKLLLPCEKSVWESPGGFTWPENRLFYHAGDSHVELSIGSLRRSNKVSKMPDQWAGQPWVERLGRWCADLDMFGWLMWTASKLQVDHRGQHVIC